MDQLNRKRCNEMTKQEQQDQLKQEAEKYINEIKTKIEMENEK